MVAERSSCALCKLRRRKCDDECLLAPHFPQDDEKGKKKEKKEKQASNVLKVFGYDRVNKTLKRLHSQYHTDFITSITFSADARVRDPVGGCSRILEILAGNIAFYSDQLRVVTNMLSYIKLNPGDYPTPYLVGDLAQSSQDDDSLPALLQLLQPDDPLLLDFLSDQIRNGEVNNEIEIGQAQATVDPPPYRVGDNQAQGQAQAPQVLIDFLSVPQLDLSGQIPYDGVDNQIDIGLEPTSYEGVDDRIDIGLEPTPNDVPQVLIDFLPVPQLDLSGQIPYDGVDNQIDIGLEPTPNDVDDQISIGLEPSQPTSYDRVDDQIEKEPEPKRRRFI